MAFPLIAIDDYANGRMYPLHTAVADEEATGYEVHHLSDGLRDELSYFMSQTVNQARTITWTLNRPRAVNFVFLDRFNNLAGVVLTWACSNDNFTTSETILSLAVPSTCMAGSPADYYGVRTEEGAWFKTHDYRVAKYWRLSIAAIVGKKPQIGGWKFGFAPTIGGFERPLEDHTDSLIVTETQSDYGTIGRGPVTRQRRGSIIYDFADDSEFETLRLHFHGHFGDGRQAIICHDQDVGQRTVVGVRSTGQFGLPLPVAYGYRVTQMDWVEDQPLAA